ncbi:MAG: hypothetical protein AAGD03_03880 [Bordetella sp.]|nr:hypothetical protein [Pseudomonadota bacterium]MDQ8016083.1 hypothetical protein [Pseudomonadota bacterium]
MAITLMRLDLRRILPVFHPLISGVHMGIALLAIADLFTPLQSLASRWMPARDARRTASAGLRYVAVRPARGGRNGATALPAPARPQGVLRVVRIVERGQSKETEGRVVISGRMADVCAELDRLAALEAAGATAAPKQLH